MKKVYFHIHIDKFMLLLFFPYLGQQPFLTLLWWYMLMFRSLPATHMSLVLPGDPIPLASSTSITLGPGIAASSSRVTLDGPGPVDTRYIATRAGLLRSSRAGKEKAVKREREREKGKEKEKGKGEQYWVEGSSKRVCHNPPIEFHQADTLIISLSIPLPEFSVRSHRHLSFGTYRQSC